MSENPKQASKPNIFQLIQDAPERVKELGAVTLAAVTAMVGVASLPNKASASPESYPSPAKLLKQYSMEMQHLKKEALATHNNLSDDPNSIVLYTVNAKNPNFYDVFHVTTSNTLLSSVGIVTAMNFNKQHQPIAPKSAHTVYSVDHRVGTRPDSFSPDTLSAGEIPLARPNIGQPGGPRSFRVTTNEALPIYDQVDYADDPAGTIAEFNKVFSILERSVKHSLTKQQLLARVKADANKPGIKSSSS